MLTAIYLSQ